MLEKKLNNIIYLILLIPIAIVPGPLIPDLVITIISLYFIIFHFKEIKIFFNKYSFFKILIIFCFINIFVSFFAENIYLSLKNSITYLRFPLFIVAVSFLLKDKYKIINYFYYVLFFTILILSLDAFLQFFSGKNVLGYISNSKNRISGLFNDEFILGSFLARMTPILIALLFYLKKNDQKIPIICVCTLSLLAILISGERTALGISIFFYLFLFLFIFNLSKKKKILLSIFLIFSLIFIIFNSEKLKNRLIKTTFLQFEAILENYKTSGNKEDLDIGVFNNQHIKHLKVSYEIFKERPFFGHGNKMFGQICFERYFENDGRCSTHPHNFLAQIFVENGIFGVLIYLSLFFYLLFFFNKALKEKNRGASTILIICLLSFFPLFPSGNFYNNMMSIFLYLPLTIFFVIYENKKIS